MTKLNKTYVRWYKIEEYSLTHSSKTIRVKLTASCLNSRHENYSCEFTWFYLVDEGAYYHSKTELKTGLEDLPFMSIASDFIESLKLLEFESEIDSMDLKKLRQILREHKFLEEKKKPETKVSKQPEAISKAKQLPQKRDIMKDFDRFLGFK